MRVKFAAIIAVVAVLLVVALCALLASPDEKPTTGVAQRPRTATAAVATLNAGNVVATGTITAGGHVVVTTPTCTSSQVPTWSGTAWICGSGGGGGGSWTVVQDSIPSSPIDNWSPSGLAANVIVSITAITPGSVTITGINASGMALGSMVMISNQTPTIITFEHNSSSSSGGNRLAMAGQVDQPLGGNETIAFWFDGATFAELWQTVATGGRVSGLTSGNVPVAASSTSLADSPLLVHSGTIELNSNQNIENIFGIIWSTGDSRTDGNLESGSDLGATDCSQSGCLTISNRIRFANVAHQSTYDVATNETNEGSGSGATNTNIEIDGSGPGGAVVINGTGAGANAGGGGLIVEKGQNSSTHAWAVDSSGDTGQAGNLQVGGTSTLGGNVTISSGYIDVNTIVYAEGDQVMLEGHGLACDYNTNSTSTCTINATGYADGATNFRNLNIDDGKGAVAVAITATTKALEVIGPTTLDAATIVAAHLSLNGTAQTGTNISSCGGGSPSITATSTDTNGTITEGTTATGCVLGFVSTWTVAPVCTCSATTAALVGCSATATTLTIVNTSASGDVINYVCFGQRGSS